MFKKHPRVDCILHPTAFKVMPQSLTLGTAIRLNAQDADAEPSSAEIQKLKAWAAPDTVEVRALVYLPCSTCPSIHPSIYDYVFIHLSISMYLCIYLNLFASLFVHLTSAG